MKTGNQLSLGLGNIERYSFDSAIILIRKMMKRQRLIDNKPAGFLAIHDLRELKRLASITTGTRDNPMGIS